MIIYIDAEDRANIQQRMQRVGRKREKLSLTPGRSIATAQQSETLNVSAVLHTMQSKHTYLQSHKRSACVAWSMTTMRAERQLLLTVAASPTPPLARTVPASAACLVIEGSPCMHACESRAHATPQRAMMQVASARSVWLHSAGRERNNLQ